MWRTLTELLAYNAETYPNLLYVRFLKRGEIVATCTYSQTYERASHWAALFIEHGLRRGDAVVLAVPNSDDFVYAYFGTLLAGGVPAPAAPIRRLKTDSYYLTNVAQRLRSIDAKIVVVPEAQASIADGPPLSEIKHLTVLTRQDVQPTSQLIAPNGYEHDFGLFQFTSGTSGNSKAVQLSNAALLAQMENTAIKIALHHDEDIALSWLPVFHDMGIIGFLLTPAIRAISTTLLLTEDFMLRPSLWIKGLSDFRASVTAGPPSAYALCARHLKDTEIAQYDLRNMRTALVGAEVISQQSLQQFAARLQPTGFRATSLVSAYGMAENCLAVTMTAVGEEPTFETIDLEAMQTQSIAQPVAARLIPPSDTVGVPGDGKSGRGVSLPASSLRPATTRTIASVGTPLPETEVAIVNQAGERLNERQVGEILVRSPSLMHSYHREPEASSATLRDGWLWTGDLGYIAHDNLYITGRKKEVLIVGGRNYYPDDLEHAAGAAVSVRPGHAVAIAYEDPVRATEAVVLLVETTATEQDARNALRQRIRQALVEADYPISEVVLLRPRTIQTTLNGKLKRVDIKDRYLKGEFSHDN